MLNIVPGLKDKQGIILFLDNLECGGNAHIDWLMMDSKKLYMPAPPQCCDN